MIHNYENYKLFKTTFINDLIINKYFTFIQIPKTSSTSILYKCKSMNLTIKKNAIDMKDYYI